MSKKTDFYDQLEGNVDLSNRIICQYTSGAISISTVAIGMKSEGYGRVINVISKIKKAGVDSLGMITLPDTEDEP